MVVLNRRAPVVDWLYTGNSPAFIHTGQRNEHTKESFVVRKSRARNAVPRDFGTPTSDSKIPVSVLLQNDKNNIKKITSECVLCAITLCWKL